MAVYFRVKEGYLYKRSHYKRTMRNEFNFKGFMYVVQRYDFQRWRIVWIVEVQASSYPGADCRDVDVSAIAVNSPLICFDDDGCATSLLKLRFLTKSIFLVSIPQFITPCDSVKQIAHSNHSATLSNRTISFSFRLTTHQQRHHRILLSPPRRWAKRLQKSKPQTYCQYYEPMHLMMPKSTKSTMSSPVSSKTMYLKPAYSLFSRPLESR